MERRGRRALVAFVSIVATVLLLAPGAAATTFGTPSYPNNLQAELTYDGTSATGVIDVSWQPPTDPGNSPITEYVVVLDAATVALTRHLAPDVLSTTFSGISLGSSHDVTVWAVNAVGDGSNVGRQIAQKYFAPSPAPYFTGVWGAPASNPPTVTLLTSGASNSGGLPVSYRITSDGAEITPQTDIPLTVPTASLGNPGIEHQLRIYAQNYAGTSSRPANDYFPLVPAPPIIATSKTVIRGTATSITARLAWSDTWTTPADGTLALVREPNLDPIGAPVAEHVWEKDGYYHITVSDGTVQIPVPGDLTTGQYRIYWSGDATHGPSLSNAVITVAPPTPTETLTLDKRTARYGSGFHLSARDVYAGKPLAGELVRFYYQRPGQPAQQFASAITNSAGIATTAYTPNRNVTFFAGTAGDPVWAAAHTATISTTTYNRVSATLSHVHRHYARISATAAPSTRLRLQRSTDRVHWHTYATVTASRASWTVRQSATHRLYFRVFAAATATTTSATTTVLSLRKS